jgi:hypothetical protein
MVASRHSTVCHCWLLVSLLPAGTTRRQSKLFPVSVIQVEIEKQSCGAHVVRVRHFLTYYYLWREMKRNEGTSSDRLSARFTGYDRCNASMHVRAPRGSARTTDQARPCSVRRAACATPTGQIESRRREEPQKISHARARSPCGQKQLGMETTTLGSRRLRTRADADLPASPLSIVPALAHLRGQRLGSGRDIPRTPAARARQAVDQNTT